MCGLTLVSIDVVCCRRSRIIAVKRESSWPFVRTAADAGAGSRSPHRLRVS